MRRVIWARSAALLLATTLAAAGLSGSATAAETGTVSGTFTGLDGSGMGGVSVHLKKWETPWDIAASGTTNASGQYSFEAVPTGNYLLWFAPAGYPSQYAPQAVETADALKVTVSMGGSIEVNEQIMPYGTFTGRLTGAGETELFLWGTATVWHNTDANGDYLVRVRPGSYQFRFTLRGDGTPQDFLYQHIPGKDSALDAQVFTIAGGQTMQVNDTVMATGHIGGTFRNAAGAPLKDVGVSITASSPTPTQHNTTTGADGTWRQRMKAGRVVQVRFHSFPLNISQYAYGTVDADAADEFTVLDGQTTTVNDTQLASGSLRVTARDKRTGRPIARFDVGNLPHVPDGNPDDGVEFFASIPVGTYSLSAFAYGYHQNFTAGQVTIVAGQQTNFEVLLEPKSRIETTVVDAQTGQPVAGVCVFGGTLERFSMGGDYPCYRSGADGKTMFEIYDETPGRYQLFAMPVDESANGYGGQWVGTTGGKGSQLEAVSIYVQKGEAAQAPVVKLDKAGTISGKITAPDGAPVPNAQVSLVDTWDGGYGDIYADAEGNYSIDNLGPYAWPLRFYHHTQATQFSGGKGNRHEATRVQVAANTVKIYNFQFRAGAPIDVVVPIGNSGCRLELVTASGDRAGQADAYPCNASPLHFNVVDGQSVKLHLYYEPEPMASYVNTWHGGNSFGDATAVPITGPATITFAAGTTSPPRVEEPAPVPVPVPRPTGTPPSLPPVPRL
ncbi:carboxypeptidase-like regulatory domain-containing protein [Catelliglobosispora koreensis]|uniref:carboxypeptidase-like regulatory domain-containing protein n=1 Tax=Catelliglobosispora koreensis TaxID=129052 RepID=UPI000368E3B0|nr:carboxypeptidase-like regulatory domain-containing protein [Catelliglobosispora koreensis]